MKLNDSLSSLLRVRSAGRRSNESGQKKRRGRAISVRYKLLLSFGLIASLTLVASGVAIVAFNEANRGFDKLSSESLPAISGASRLAVESNNVVLLAARLLAAKDADAQKQVHDQLSGVTSRFLSATEKALDAAGGGNADPSMKDNASQLVDSLTKLDAAIAREIEANDKKTARLATLFALHEDLANRFVPLVDDAYFTLLTGGDEVKTKSKQLVDTIVNKDMTQLRAFLDARVEINVLSGVLVSAVLVDTVADMKPFEDRATAAHKRLVTALAAIASGGKEFDFFKQVNSLVEVAVGPSSIFGQVERTGVMPFNRRDIIAIVLKLQVEIDGALVTAIDDATFELAISSDDASTKNTDLITKLLDDQVTSLKNALTASGSLHQFVATLVQGALTDDESQVVPIQDRVVAESGKLRDVVDAIADKEVSEKFNQLLAFGDSKTGLLAGRAVEFEAHNAAHDLIKQMLSLSGGLGGLLELMIDGQRVSVEDDASAVRAQINLGSVILLVLGAASLLIAAGVGYFMVERGLARPLAATIEAMKKLAEGDLDIEVPSTDRNDEIGSMAQAVGVFHENARTRVRLEAEQAEATAAETARQQRIDQLIADFRSSVRDMLNAVGENMAQMRDTAAILTEISDDTSSKSATAATASEDTSGNVQTVAAATEELNASISEIGRQITQAMQVTGQATDMARTSNEKVSGLATAAQEIGDVVSLIQGIAEQTNLLALNATIEAARAGEMGKGFAVVASEVKMLANQTAKATEEIASKIQMIQESTKGTVDSIQAIVEQIDEVNGYTSAVSAAVEQQGGATSEINHSVQQAAVASEKVVSDMRDVTRTAGEANQSAAQVARASSEVADQAAELRSLCDRFLEEVAAA